MQMHLSKAFQISTNTKSQTDRSGSYTVFRKSESCNDVLSKCMLMNTIISRILTVIVCMGYLFLCPLDAIRCSTAHIAASAHPFLCFGSINFLIHRELLPSISSTSLGTMVNGDYGSDAAIGWTSILTFISIIASIYLYFKSKRRDLLILAAPLVCHWLCLYLFFNIMMDKSTP